LSAHLKEDTKRREDDGENDLADIAGINQYPMMDWLAPQN
jgi:hypothetical protein